MTNQELSKKILELVGGKSNVAGVANCMTRLRLRIKDYSLVKLDEIKATEGVLGIQEDETLQIVLGPGKAKKVADLCAEELGTKSMAVEEDWEKNKAAIKAGQKDSGFKQFLHTLSNIFIPLMPAIIAAGLLSGLASVMGQIPFTKAALAAAAVALKDGIAMDGGVKVIYIIHQLLTLLNGAFLTYFAIYTGINAAKEFGATPALGGMIGAASINVVNIATALGLYNKDIPLNSILTNGKGGIIGVILGVWILSKVERAIRKAVPDVLDLIITPLTSILIVGSLYVLVLMPVTGFLSDKLVFALNLIIASSNPVVAVISGYVLAAVFLPLVLFGLHHGLIPIYAIQKETIGGITLFPVLAMAGAGQVGAAFAIILKAKSVGNHRLAKTALGALPAGFLGVGEPLIYGVTLPLGRPFITAGLGAGFGGAYVMLTGVMATAFGPSGLVALPLMKTGAMALNFFIGLVISYIMGFIITWFGIKAKDVENA